MKIEPSPVSPQDASADWLIVPVHETPSDVDGWLEGAIGRRREAGDFVGRLGETLTLFETSAAASRVLLAGCGPVDRVDRAAIRHCLRAAMLAITTRPAARVALVVPEGDRGLWCEEAATAAMLAGTSQGLYKADPKRHPIGSLVLVGLGEGDGHLEAAAIGQTIGESMNVVRELVNRPANDVYPETFADRAAQLAREAGLECDVLGPDWLEQERFFSMLAVAQGSERPARLVVLKYRGRPNEANSGSEASAGGEGAMAGDGSRWLGLCGKGVTFDSGGLSIKPSDSMKSMKADMAGGATVLGTMLAIAKLKLPINVLGAIGLVENMISGGAYRVSDVLRSRSGRTIEVHNTDAEGRLVLADVLNWTADQGVGGIVDLATLTGAVVVALGEEYTGVFPGDESLGDLVLTSAAAMAEPAWPMPMDDRFAKLLESETADCKNVGPRWGGAITAAKFLQPFVGPTPWVHLDIAGAAMAESSSPEQDSGGTGAMLPTLVELARRWE